MWFARAITALFLLLTLPSRALAYRRSTVEGVPDRGLFWADRAIDVELASASSSDVTAGDLRTAMRRSLTTWTEPACSDIVLSDVGDALGLSTNLLDGVPDGRNRVVVREDGWPAEIGPETLALTSIVYERDTGRVLDADIDLNAVANAFGSTTPALSDRDDVENTLTHELGHLLGLAHVVDPEATMYEGAELGETRKRDLSPDDLLAICETYPTGRPTPSELPPAPSAASGGCAATAGRASSSSLAAALALIIVRAGRRARRRARVAGTAS